MSAGPFFYLSSRPNMGCNPFIFGTTWPGAVGPGLLAEGENGHAMYCSQPCRAVCLERDPGKADALSGYMVSGDLFWHGTLVQGRMNRAKQSTGLSAGQKTKIISLI